MVKPWKFDYWFVRGESQLVHAVTKIELPKNYYKKAKVFLEAIEATNSRAFNQQGIL